MYLRVAAILLLLVSSADPQTAKPSAGANPFTAGLLTVWKSIEQDFISAADAMPEDRWDFAPTDGEFKGVRTFAQQVKHVACANYGFFNEIENKTPPARCFMGGPSPAKTKAELMKYLRDSFAYADQVLATVNEQNGGEMVKGPYRPDDNPTKASVAVLAIWHASDHYGQMIEYLRMNGIVPLASR